MVEKEPEVEVPVATECMPIKTKKRDTTHATSLPAKVFVRTVQGYADAQYNVGAYYVNGTGVEQSDIEACKYYTLAADQGHRDAQFNLGSMHEQGKGGVCAKLIHKIANAPLTG